MKIEITNQQNLKRINRKLLTNRLNLAGAKLNISSKKVSFLFCDNAFIRKLHKKFFNDSSATDVISFELRDVFDPDNLGEIVVSIEEAVNVSKKYGNTWTKEFTLYCMHGLLHLVGYDDLTKTKKVKMDKIQQELADLIFKG